MSIFAEVKCVYYGMFYQLYSGVHNIQETGQPARFNVTLQVFDAAFKYLYFVSLSCADYLEILEASAICSPNGLPRSVMG